MNSATRAYPASGEDIDVLARTIFGEARGESLEGQIAVAWCIRHRAEFALAYVARHNHPHRLYGDGSIAAACKMPWQFSCWNENDPTHAAMLAVGLSNPAFQHANMVALQVISGRAEDGMPGTTHYYNHAAVKHDPAWVQGAVLVATVGSHRFYKDVK
jgi:N-acetylmuramoyl-L-alanine amidase